MSYGIPSLYIASKDSQLSIYSIKYGHAKCFSNSDLNLAANFIKDLSTDLLIKQKMSENAIKASFDFKRSNADKFVEKYFA